MNRQAFIGCLNFVVVHRVSADFEGLWILGGAVVLAYVFSCPIQAADQWSKAVVLRPGKFRSLQEPGTDQPEILCLAEPLTSSTLRGIRS